MGMISSSLLPEFDHEMANTRKTLERVPDNKMDWKPHPKSMSMNSLASHLAFRKRPGWSWLAPGGQTSRRRQKLFF